MKYSLQIIAFSLFLFLGLGIGPANAITSTLPFNNNGLTFHTSSGINGTSSVVVNHIANFTSPTGTNLTQINRSKPAELELNFSTIEIPDSANAASFSTTTSMPTSLSNETKSSPTNNQSLKTSGHKNNFANHDSQAVNSQHVSEHQSYAMLLVGLGLLVFTARRRTNA